MLVHNLLFGIVYDSQLYYLPLFFQNAHRLSPLTSAALLLPMTGAQMAASILSGQCVSRRERYGNTSQKAMPPEFASLSQSAYHTPDLDALGASPAKKRNVLHAYARANRLVFIMNTPFIGLCLLGCLLIKDCGLQRPDGVKPEVKTAQSNDTGLVQDIDTEPEYSSSPTTTLGTLECAPRMCRSWAHPLDHFSSH